MLPIPFNTPIDDLFTLAVYPCRIDPTRLELYLGQRTTLHNVYQFILDHGHEYDHELVKAWLNACSTCSDASIILKTLFPTFVSRTPVWVIEIVVRSVTPGSAREGFGNAVASDRVDIARVLFPFCNRGLPYDDAKYVIDHDRVSMLELFVTLSLDLADWKEYVWVDLLPYIFRKPQSPIRTAMYNIVTPYVPRGHRLYGVALN